MDNITTQLLNGLKKETTKVILILLKKLKHNVQYILINHHQINIFNLLPINLKKRKKKKNVPPWKKLLTNLNNHIKNLFKIKLLCILHPKKYLLKNNYLVQLILIKIFLFSSNKQKSITIFHKNIHN
jgi:hypothetical protein